MIHAYQLDDLYQVSLLTGATIFPVCPTCISFGTNPASTAALEAPTEEQINDEN